MFLLFLGICLTIDSLYEIDEIVVTATRYPVTLQNIALATEVITREDLEFSDPLTIGEVLNDFAGLGMRDYGNPAMLSSPVIRGIPANGILVLVDGHPLNHASTGIADVNSIDVNSLYRIEVVKGPVSSLYGANALGGVINLITQRFYEKPEITLKYMPSTTTWDTPFQSNRMAVIAGAPFGPLSLGMSGAYLSSEGVRPNSDHDGYSIEGNAIYRADRLQLRSTAAYNHREYGVPGPLPPDSGSVTSESDREKDRLFRTSVDVHWKFNEFMEYHGTVFGDRNTTFFTSNDTLAGIVEEYLYETSKIGLHNLFHLDLYYTRLTCGFDFRYDTLNASEYSLFSDTAWEASVWNAGAWAALTAYITDELALSPSVRVDRNQTFGFFLSPHLGVIQRYGDMFIVKASVGKAFRAPTLNDLYYPLSGNEQLKPEHGWSYELRFEGMPAHYMFAAFSFYFREVYDRITWLPIDEAIWRPHNMNSLTMKGFDLETMVTISNWINISLQGTALEARQRNNEIVYDYYDYGGDSSVTIIHEIERKAAFIPDFSIVLMMTFSLPYGLNCGIEGRYVSEQCNYYPDYSDYPVITMDTKILASFNVYDLYIQKRLHRFASLSTGIKNVLNSEYATQFGYSIHDRDFPMPGRTFYVEVSVHY